MRNLKFRKTWFRYSTTTVVTWKYSALDVERSQSLGQMWSFLCNIHLKILVTEIKISLIDFCEDSVNEFS